MSEGEMNEVTKDYYNKIIEEHRKTGTEKAMILAESLGVSLPNGAEQIALKPDAAMDWARRIVKVGDRFKRVAGNDLDVVSDEQLKQLHLDPVDVQAVKLGFVQFYTRFLMEVELALDPNAKPEDVSEFRGGGQFMENWLEKEASKEPEGESELEIAFNHLETLRAASLVVEPNQGFIESGKLMYFVHRVEKSQSSTGPVK